MTVWAIGKSFDLEGLEAGGYFFWVTSYRNQVRSWRTSFTSVVLPGAEPAAPTDLRVTPVGSFAILFWTDNSGDETGFEVQVLRRGDLWYRETVDAGSLFTFVGGLEPDVPYTFRVSSYSRDGSSSSQAVMMRWPTRDGPAGPTNLRATVTDDTSVRLTWTDTSDDELGFEVRANVSGWRGTFPVAADTESLEIRGLARGGRYGFHVVADHGDVLSAASNTVVVGLVIKVLDGTAINGNYWVFFGALSDVEYWVTVEDTQGERRLTYHNPPKEICGQSDDKAFSGNDSAARLASSAGVRGEPGIDLVRLEALPLSAAGVGRSEEAAGQCEPGEELLCLLEDRFSVEVSFVDPRLEPPDNAKRAKVVPSLTTTNTGFFWFFNQENIELAVKVLDGRRLNGNFWFLYGGLSDVQYKMTVDDTVTGEFAAYTNEKGSLCGQVDTEPF